MRVWRNKQAQNAVLPRKRPGGRSRRYLRNQLRGIFGRRKYELQVLQFVRRRHNDARQCEQREERRRIYGFRSLEYAVFPTPDPLDTSTACIPTPTATKTTGADGAPWGWRNKSHIQWILMMMRWIFRPRNGRIRLRHQRPQCRVAQKNMPLFPLD